MLEFADTGGSGSHGRLAHPHHPRFTSLMTHSTVSTVSTFGTTSAEDLVANFRSLVGGVGWHAYPRDWWLPCLEKFLRKYDLLPIVSLGSVATWVREGKRAQQGSGVDTTGV